MTHDMASGVTGLLLVLSQGIVISGPRFLFLDVLLPVLNRITYATACRHRKIIAR